MALHGCGKSTYATGSSSYVGLGLKQFDQINRNLGRPHLALKLVVHQRVLTNRSQAVTLVRPGFSLLRNEGAGFRVDSVGLRHACTHVVAVLIPRSGSSFPGLAGVLFSRNERTGFGIDSAGWRGKPNQLPLCPPS